MRLKELNIKIRSSHIQVEKNILGYKIVDGLDSDYFSLGISSRSETPEVYLNTKDVWIFPSSITKYTEDLKVYSYVLTQIDLFFKTFYCK